jgi:hypothetical protein
VTIIDDGGAAMPDRLTPKTSLERGPVERPIELGYTDHEYFEEAGGDTEAMDVDANVGGASATAGLDSGGAVGVTRGPAVGRPGYAYANAPRAEVPSDSVVDLEASEAEFGRAEEVPGSAVGAEEGEVQGEELFNDEESP